MQRHQERIQNRSRLPGPVDIDRILLCDPIRTGRMGSADAAEREVSETEIFCRGVFPCLRKRTERAGSIIDRFNRRQS